jgi:hypothetical protein
MLYKELAPPGGAADGLAISEEEFARDPVGVISRLRDASELDFGPAVLDPKHIGDIRGSLGTISMRDRAPRTTWRARPVNLAAIVGPGLIVMTGDNDAGGVQTYTQAGEQYGTSLLWVLAALFVVLFAAQEMVTRLGGGDRGRPCPSDPRAVRPVLEPVLGRRPLRLELPNPAHRVHRRELRHGLFRHAEVVQRRRRGAAVRFRANGQFPAASEPCCWW